MDTLLSRAAGFFHMFMRWLAGVSIPVKLLVSAFFGILGGSGYIGFLSEYAAYGYALYYGFRPPFEGVPYLRSAVTAISFSLLSLTALLFFAVFSSLRATIRIHELSISKTREPYFVRCWKKMGFEEARLSDLGRYIRALPNKDFLALSKCWLSPWPPQFGHLVLAVLFVVPVISAKLFERGLNVALIIVATIAAIVLVYIYIVISFNGVSLALIRWRSISWYSAVAAAVLLLVGGPILFFNIQFYNRFLQFTGYGGGLYVSVDTEPSPSIPEGRINGGLLLRTGEAVFVYLNSGEIMEIPMAKVRVVSHSTEERAISLPPPQNTHRETEEKR